MNGLLVWFGLICWMYCCCWCVCCVLVWCLSWVYVLYGICICLVRCCLWLLVVVGCNVMVSCVLRFVWVMWFGVCLVISIGMVWCWLLWWFILWFRKCLMVRMLIGWIRWWMSNILVVVNCNECVCCFDFDVGWRLLVVLVDGVKSDGCNVNWFEFVIDV